MLSPVRKYRPFPSVELASRRWPEARLETPPIWMSTDLRDGNQALFEPMSIEKKMRMFKMLCAIGIKEIEVAFPSASETDFAFTRSLIEGGHIPDDVTIVALTQARAPLIERTFEALKGAKSAIVHVYTATSPTFRDIVFGMDRDKLMEMTIDSIRQIKELSKTLPETKITLEYSPETFSATELAFSLEICDAVVATWEATPENKIILNLPATVEVATPNVYADQIEWMHTRLARRDSIILSLHTHNDRGCAIAAAELGLMAGGERIEGCLFGNGERTGNADIVTLALNLYTQGISPGLDFSDINAIARTFEQCSGLPIHPRHPYAGDLVFTAFSGSHQDAIKKGMQAQKDSRDGVWNVPYLPLDPTDVGRNYDSLIRVNSQSGKGGIAYLMETEHGLVMPRRLQVEFSAIVQSEADQTGDEITADKLWQLFSRVYLETNTPLCYKGHVLDPNGKTITLTVDINGESKTLFGQGNGPIDAAIHALAVIGMASQVVSFEERSLKESQEGEAQAVAFMEIRLSGEKNECYGVGMDENIITASLKALISGVNRRAAHRE